jgi:serine/threonine-protein kinase
MWEAGTMVGEQIRLARPLGDGTSETVWVADQLDWRKQVVVKFVTQGLPLNDFDALVGFIEAASEVAQIECPRLVQTFDHGLTDDGVPYVVMELLQGESLEQRLKRGRIAPLETGKVVAQVAEALQCVHAADQVHAGIDPGSIFMCEGPAPPDVTLLNLGVASARAVRRTNSFLSPEQYMLKPADFRSDLWSLGAVAYQMLTGELPVDAKQRRNLKWDFTPPSEMWLSDIPDGIDGWFTRALAKRSADRFDSVRQMADEFIALMPGMESALSSDVDAPSQGVDVGAHKVIAVGTPPVHEPPEEEDEDSLAVDEEVSIEVDD